MALSPSAAPNHLTLTATDVATVLTTGSATWRSIAAQAWLGTNGSMRDSAGNLNWFQTGVTPVQARVDGPASVRALHFDVTKQFLYVVDYIGNRILKYDYLNRTYLGWIGAFYAGGGIGITGSALATPSAAACISTVNYGTVPG